MKNKYKLVTATWCAPCKVLKTQLDEEGIEVEFVDAIDDSEYVQKMGVRSVPTLVVDDDELISSDILEYLKNN